MELQTVISFHVVAGIEPRFAARAISVLNHLAISPVPVIEKFQLKLFSRNSVPLGTCLVNFPGFCQVSCGRVVKMFVLGITYHAHDRIYNVSPCPWCLAKLAAPLNLARMLSFCLAWSLRRCAQMCLCFYLILLRYTNTEIILFHQKTLQVTRKHENL